MFSPTTTRIRKLAQIFPKRISELEKILSGPTNIYIDLANVLPWQNRLRWHFHLERILQLFRSFDSVKKVKLYAGTLVGNQKSEDAIRNAEAWGYDVHTKDVKIIPLSIDASSIAPNSPALLQQFIRKALLEKLDLVAVEFLNQRLADLNRQGITKIEDKKCNFDVEIGRDMLRDYDRNGIETFILWSKDSDFADPVNQLLADGKHVFQFATARGIPPEIKAPLYDVRKIREFICWSRELPTDVRERLDKMP